MPTGGVTIDNAGDWIRAGAVAVGIGTALLDAGAIAAGDYRALRDRAERLVAQRARCARRVMTARVVTFGEIMLRLSPPGFERLLQSPHLSATFGGGEANVAVSLAHFGLRQHVTSRAFRRIAIGDAAVRRRCAPRASTSTGSRAAESESGIYYAETRRQPAPLDRHLRPRALGDQRDRPAAVNWKGALSGAAWFHVTGITPALGAGGGRGDALRDRRGPRRRRPRQRRSELPPQALVRGAGARGDDADDARRRRGHRQRGRPAVGARRRGARHRRHQRRARRRRISARCRKCHARTAAPQMVAITLRESRSATDNGWSAVCGTGAAGTLHRSQAYDMRVVDRVGGGDSFAAGLIYGLVSGSIARRARSALRSPRARSSTPFPVTSTASPLRRSIGWPRATRPAACSDNAHHLHLLEE